MDQTAKNKDRVRVTTRSMSTAPEDLLSTETNDPVLAPGSVTPGVECGAAMLTADPLITPKEINQHFQTATKNFELIIKKASEKFLEEIRGIEENINTALNIERDRIDEIEKKNASLEVKVNQMKGEVSRLQKIVDEQVAANNKAERFSRRNNLRIVGVPEKPDENGAENCIKIVEDIFKRKFDGEMKVERAHRDGKKLEGKPRHVLVKLLSYRDKVEIMKSSRVVLKDEKFFITDDLTKKDLEEKRKHRQEVQTLYGNGTKLRFFAGKWRLAGGVAYEFNCY